MREHEKRLARYGASFLHVSLAKSFRRFEMATAMQKAMVVAGC